jgi:hydrogenase expression/formation protein HypE
MPSRPLLPSGAPFRIAAVAFDFDGTLTEPDLDFSAMRRALGCPPGEGVLEFIASLPDAEERRRSRSVMEGFEIVAAQQARPSAGAEELVRRLVDRGVPVAIITRNGQISIDIALTRFSRVEASDFAVIVTRDLPLPFKPSPDGVEYVAERLGVPVEQLLVVGDHPLDARAGRTAGALTALLASPGDMDVPRDAYDVGGQADFLIDKLLDVERLVRFGSPLPPGKLPADLLQEALAAIVWPAPSLLVAPGIGEDVAAVDIDGHEVLVLTSDPVTLASEDVAHYAVTLSANDIATAGATPRWFVATLLFPPGSTASEVYAVMLQLKEACDRLSIVLCGGHTEITDAVRRTTIVGTMAGTVPRAGLLRKAGMQEGDRILMTKAVAVEGTALLARESGARLAGLGVSAQELGQGAALLDRISVVEEAAIARSFSGVTALHDVTEGGLATALVELSEAGRHQVHVRVDDIPVLPLTARVCGLLGLDPLGLLGSGSLLITCSAQQATPLVAALRAADIDVSDVGEVRRPGIGVIATLRGQETEWPVFERDELTRQPAQG